MRANEPLALCSYVVSFIAAVALRIANKEIDMFFENDQYELREMQERQNTSADGSSFFVELSCEMCEIR